MRRFVCVVKEQHQASKRYLVLLLAGTALYMPSRKCFRHTGCGVLAIIGPDRNALEPHVC